MMFNRFLLAVGILMVSLELLPIVQAAEPEVRTTNSNLVTRVGPGDSLPISVKLTNFGGNKRADVTITYQILNKDEIVALTSTETVAVETTASFTKILEIPRDFKPGTYTAKSSIIYLGQKVPATAGFEFIVERKIAGIFLSSFINYAIITLIVGLIFAFVSRLIIKKHRANRFSAHEYPEVPTADRVYFEIISDAIMQMRYRIGDRALNIAKGIDGLVVDADTGRVLKINNKPAQVIALLVSNYEEQIGQKVSFAFAKPSGTITGRESEAEKNLVVIRKRQLNN